MMRFYYGPERAESDHFCVHGMGIHELMPPGRIRHGGPGGPCLIICFHSATLLGESNVKLQPGETVVWGSEQWHDYGEDFAEWDHSWILCSGKLINEAIRSSRLPLGVPLGHHMEASADHWFASLYRELHGSQNADIDMQYGILQLYLREVSRLHFGEQETLPPAIDEARRFLEHHLAQPLQLQEIAEKAHLSVSRFSELFREHVGSSPMKYLQRLRLQRASDLLRNSELAVYQVAELVGYDDPLHFSRQFKRFTGESPREWRQQRYR